MDQRKPRKKPTVVVVSTSTTLEWLYFKEHLLDAKGIGWKKEDILSAVGLTDTHITPHICPFTCNSCPKDTSPPQERVIGDIATHCAHVQARECVCPWAKGSKIWQTQARWWSSVSKQKAESVRAYIEEVWE